MRPILFCPVAWIQGLRSICRLSQARPPLRVFWYFAVLLSSYTYKGHGPPKIHLWTPGDPLTPGWEPLPKTNDEGGVVGQQRTVGISSLLTWIAQRCEKFTNDLLRNECWHRTLRETQGANTSEDRPFGCCRSRNVASGHKVK